MREGAWRRQPIFSVCHGACCRGAHGCSGRCDGSEERGARRSLVPALVGVGGLLLLLSMGFSGSVRGWVMLVFVCAAAFWQGLRAYGSIGCCVFSGGVGRSCGDCNAVFFWFGGAVAKTLFGDGVDCLRQFDLFDGGRS